MFKRFGLRTLGLAAALAVAVPAMSIAAERDGHGGRDFARGGDVGRHEVYRDHDDHRFIDRDRRGFGFGVGVYAAPVPVPVPSAPGYYDQFGVWHPYGYYDQFGVYHAY